jgi:hypothetical protein
MKPVRYVAAQAHVSKKYHPRRNDGIMWNESIVASYCVNTGNWSFPQPNPSLLRKMLQGLSHRSAGYNEQATKWPIHFFDQKKTT